LKQLIGFLITFFLIQVFAFQMANAQESCDTKTKISTHGGSATFMQMEYCGDADLTTVFTCSKDSNRIKLVLPISAFDPDDQPGKSFNNTFKFDKVVTERTLKTVAPVKGGAGDVGAEITLDADDPLWKALLTPNLNVASENSNSSTSVGTFEESKDKIATFKKTYGL
jgi:hypothetical protein